MPLTKTPIKKLCVRCNKHEPTISIVGAYRILKCQCGSVIPEKLSDISEEKTDEQRLKEMVSEDGRKLRPWQIKRILQATSANGRVLFNQEMGLGKTILALGTLYLNFNEMTPCLIVCKAGLKSQLFWEVHRWLGKRNEKGEWEGVIAQVIDGSKERPALKFFKVVIVSYETLAGSAWVEDEAFAGKFKTVILDEIQKVKNPEAKMTKAVRNLVRGVKIKRERIFTPVLASKTKVVEIATDLMKYNGVADRFELQFGDIRPALGKTQVNITGNNGEGRVTGRIILDNSHCENADVSHIIDTILHEIAHAMSPGAGHSWSWQKICTSIGGDGKPKAYCDGTGVIESFIEVEEKPEYLLGMSGTYVKNNAAEAFTALNLFHPDRFRVKEHFIREFVDNVWDGYKYKCGGIKRYAEDRFRQLTEDFIFRDLRKDVEKEIPPVDRQFRVLNMGDKVEEAYLKKLGEFEDEFGGEEPGSMSFQRWSNALAMMNEMRQIVGAAKVEPTAEYVEEFLENTDKKIVIFVHHINVGTMIDMKLRKICRENDVNEPLRLSSDLNDEQRHNIVNAFREDPKNRVLVASTLAAGEGLNLQFCSDCVIMERQWNPANEEQAEARFTRIGSEASHITALYPVALGSIDEFFSELVEKKRIWMAQVQDGAPVTSVDETSLMKELAAKLLSTGRKKWKMA